MSCRKVCAHGPFLDTAVSELLLSRERAPLGTWQLKIREIGSSLLSELWFQAQPGFKLPGYCCQSGLGSGSATARALVRSVVLLFTACALCSALSWIYLPGANVPPALPWLPVVKPQPGSCSPEEFQPLSLTVPLCGFPPSLFCCHSKIQALGVWSSLSRECFAGWVSGFSVSQVGTIPSLLGWCQDQDSPACKGF